ncbi:MAG: ubiquinone/menaquinone biosynthesis protein [Planctomycetes bacterium]|nr:ubiquinone/menaquinone biosynthesis protein [Planctomycetota bacterium]
MTMQDKIQHQEPPTCDDRLLWDVWLSTYHFPTLTVADELGLFPLLEKKPVPANEIAKSLSLGPRATEAVLGVLTSLGFLSQHHGRFSITEVSRNFLLPDSPYYWGGVLHSNRDRSHVRIRMALQRDSLQSLSEDKPDIEQWEAGKLDPKRAEALTRWMHSHSFPAAMGVARRGNFAGVNRLLDVAGGSGCFCIALAMRNPEICFTVMDLPQVCKLTEQYVSEYGLQEQIDTYSADMFKDPWPSGYNAVFLSNVFHDWDKELCIRLGRRSFELLPSGGSIYLHEMLLEDTKDRPITVASFSMQMLLGTKGKQFTAAELDEMLRECGFDDITVVHSYGYYSLISGRKP